MIRNPFSHVAGIYEFLIVTTKYLKKVIKNNKVINKNLSFCKVFKFEFDFNIKLEKY